MNRGTHERGQALILIVFALIGLFGITGLAVDGGMAYSDRRRAQNAADNAALAAALAYARGGNVSNTALASARTNGFDNNGASNTVAVSESNARHCPFNGIGKEINVTITSHLSTYFAPVIGIRQVANTVQAISESCAPYVGPMFPGNAIIALTPHNNGFDAHGNPTWNVVGGGIFSNSSDAASATCGGSATVDTPSVTTVGGMSLNCSHTGTTTTGASQYTYADYAALLPPEPKCDGQAKNEGGIWQVQPDADGSKVAISGDMTFGPGLFCVTNSPGSYHGQLVGAGVTFYLMDPNFSMKFNGHGNLGSDGVALTAPNDGDYKGVLIFSMPHSCMNPLTQTQSIDFRGNGNGNIVGSIIVPCASVTMFGNSNNAGLHTQIIAYNVDSGGTADISINYKAEENWQTHYPAWLTLFK